MNTGTHIPRGIWLDDPDLETIIGRVAAVAAVAIAVIFAGFWHGNLMPFVMAVICMAVALVRYWVLEMWRHQGKDKRDSKEPSWYGPTRTATQLATIVAAAVSCFFYLNIQGNSYRMTTQDGAVRGSSEQGFVFMSFNPLADEVKYIDPTHHVNTTCVATSADGRTIMARRVSGALRLPSLDDAFKAYTHVGTDEKIVAFSAERLCEAFKAIVAQHALDKLPSDLVLGSEVQRRSEQALARVGLEPNGEFRISDVTPYVVGRNRGR